MKHKINVVAAAIIIDGRILVARRSEGLSHGGLWELPGGKVESQESDQEALIREIKEELNLDIFVQAPVAESNVTVKGRDIQMRVYHCHVVNLDAIECHVHSDVFWANPSDIYQLDWAPADIPIRVDLCRLLQGDNDFFIE